MRTASVASRKATVVVSTNAAFRPDYSNAGTSVLWLNLASKQEIDELYHRWREAGAKIIAEPEDKPWNLREFTVADLDGNRSGYSTTSLIIGTSAKQNVGFARRY